MEAKPYLQDVILKKDLIPSLDAYPFNIPAISGLSSLKFHPDVTFIVGEKGAGKSTLIEGIALALGFGIEGGTMNVHFRTHDNGSELHNYLSTVKSSYFYQSYAHWNFAAFNRTDILYIIVFYVNLT